MADRTIEREIRVEAAPEVVYEVISSPKHLREWWPDDADLEPVAGATGTVSFGEKPDGKVVSLTVIEADPPRRFAFRWDYPDGETATEANSLLVTFDLVAAGTGTVLRFAETGFDEASDAQYRDHINGWNYFLPRLVPYVDRLVSAP